VATTADLMSFKANAQCTPIARTGRVQTWIDEPDGRLPVSCTVFVVDDSMEGSNGIEASWRFTSYALRNGAGVALHLSKLRPRGTTNDKGLVASGPVSFGKIYSVLNEILRRGGTYKNGAIVLHLDYTHPDAIEFIKAPRQELPWVKRCLNVDANLLKNSSPELIDELLRGIRSGDIWLNKIKYDQDCNRIYGNVCLEVYLPHRGTCLLEHVNLGACTVEEIPTFFTEAMEDLCYLHERTGLDEDPEYLSPAVDRQVGLGILGLANFLALHKVSYKQLADAIDSYYRLEADNWIQHKHSTAEQIVAALVQGFQISASVAREKGMKRAFSIAPTASCSYRYLDRKGFTTAPEIAPPIAREVDRDSGTFGVESFNYGNVEIAGEVGWYDYQRVANGIAQMLNDTNLFHGYSFNSWSDVVTYNRTFLQDWLNSPQTSLYYSLQVLPNTQRKDDAYAVLDKEFQEIFLNTCTTCAE